MPITVLSKSRRQGKRQSVIEERRRKRHRFEQEVARFIQQYCSDHQAFLIDPKEYYRAQLHEKNPGAARGFGDDGSQPRYFSPYDEEQRFRHHEAVGGYRSTRYGSDGVAIRAAQGYTHTANESSGAEGFQRVSGNRASSKPVLPQASMPNPVKVSGRWEYPDNPNFFTYAALYRGYNTRATRFASMPVEPPLPPFLYGEPRGLFTSLISLPSERIKSRAKANRNQFEHSYGLRPEDFAGYQPTAAEIAEWRKKYWSTRRHFDCREGRLEPWCVCEGCQKWYPNLERAEWRTVWCVETGEDLTTRKMRDLNARLELYRYGDHHWQPRVMRKVTAKRLQAAFTAIPHTARYFCPSYDRAESLHYRETVPLEPCWST